jgi:predicted nuclease with RNAse H fold
MAAPIERLDVPAELVSAEAILRETVTRHIAARDWDEDELVATCEAIQLVTHPDAPVSTDADYPNWTPGGQA